MRDVLISLAILAMVAAVLIPYYIGRKTKSIEAANIRNLRQWGIALNLYLIENEHTLPGIGAKDISPDQTHAWYNALPPYILQKPLAEIPPEELPRPGTPSVWMDPAAKPLRNIPPGVPYFNYAMNRYLQPEADLRSFKINELRAPGGVIFMTEVAGFLPWVEPSDVVFRYGNTKPDSPEAKTYVLFCDGHVDARTRAELVNDPASREAANAEKGLSWFEK